MNNTGNNTPNAQERGLAVSENQHAYLLEGAWADVKASLDEALTQMLGLSLVGNPDCTTLLRERLSVEDARDIKERVSVRPVAGSRKALIVCTSRLTREAQNALLKTLEEPPVGTYLFLVVPSRTLVLPTVRSRLSLLAHNGAHADDRAADTTTAADARAFLNASAPQRLALVEKVLRVAEDDPAHVRWFLDELERALHRERPPSDAPSAGAYEPLLLVRRHIDDTSASKKMLLEYLALTLPDQ